MTHCVHAHYISICPQSIRHFRYKPDKMALQDKWSKDYESDFDSEWYLANYLVNPSGELDESKESYLQFVLNNLHDVFSKGIHKINDFI